MSKHPKSVRIGCWSAFWGDSVSGAHQLVKLGNISYLVGDYLAEVTMGILARQRLAASKAASPIGAQSSSERGTGGYVSEFAKWVWRPLMREIVQRNIKVVTNAGGLDPVALKTLLEELSRDGGFDTIPKIAAVYGDDLSDRVAKHTVTLSEFQTVGQSERIPSKQYVSQQGEKKKILFSYFFSNNFHFFSLSHSLSLFLKDS